MNSFSNRPLALVILDGWGIGPHRNGNAISMAHTPYYDEICARFPMTSLNASGEAVGLPNGAPGNAEAGHMNIGTGRIAKTDVLRIADAVSSGEFFENPVLKNAFETAARENRAVHLIGLMSDADVHSSPENLFALVRMAKRMGLTDVFVHCILDGRDVPPRTADIYVEALEIKLADIGIGKIASLCGRFFAMDNSDNWERTVRAFTMLVHGEGERAEDPGTAIRSSFLRGISDEFIAPIVIESEPGVPVATVCDGDVVVFFNHRPDTMRQLVRSLAMPEPGGVVSAKPRVEAVCLTEYDRSFGLPVAFRSGAETNTLTQVFAEHNIHTYRITESDRFAHITNFFDGGSVSHFSNEKHLMVPSGKQADRELEPEMRSFKITDALLRGIEGDLTGVFVVNMPSPGMVAETGNVQRAIDAVQFTDTCLGGVMRKMHQANGVAILTASHGNCEDMSGPDGEPNRHSTANPVPFHLIGNDVQNLRLRDDGSLRDIAPTILGFLGLPVPQEMTGRDLRQI